MTDPGTVDVHSLRPLATVVVTGIAVVLILLSRRLPRIRESWTILAAVVKFSLVMSMIPDAISGRIHVTEAGTLAPGIEFTFRADPLGLLFAAVASGLYVLTALYSIGYLRESRAKERTRFFAALAASLSATMGVAFASNLLMLFLFYELLTIATYPLVAHKESAAARAAGYKYLAYALTGGVVVVMGTVTLFSLTGTVTFTPGGIADLANADPWFARAVFALLVAGFGVKAALIGVHSWLPSAMVAPTPVSGLLHAVAVVKSGVFGIARTVLEVFGPETVSELGLDVPLAVVAATTILVASLLALRQDNIKRLLAYSTIAQLSYIVLGLAVLSPLAIIGALAHIPAHAVAKLTLFFCAGALHVEVGVDDVSEVAGVGRRMPLTMGAFAIASFSMAGIPLLAGFVSKWYLVVGSVDASLLPVVAVLVISGVLNVAYFWPVVYAAFFQTPDGRDPMPVLEGVFGGRAGSGSVNSETTGSGNVRSDGGRDSEERDGTDASESSSVQSHWEAVGWRGGETSDYMLVPLLGTLALVVLFGTIADWLFILDLARLAVEHATGVSLP